jgi:hypothetical protein
MLEVKGGRMGQRDLGIPKWWTDVRDEYWYQ